MITRFFIKLFVATTVMCVALAGCDSATVLIVEDSSLVVPQSPTAPAADQPEQQIPSPIPQEPNTPVTLETPVTPEIPMTPETPVTPVTPVTPEVPTAEPPESTVVPLPLLPDDVPETPTATPAQIATPADITDLILVTGQSNALGADTEYDASLDGSVSRVFAFTDQGWQVADLSQIWDQDWFPRTSPLTDPSNNFSLHFGKKVAQLDSDRVVGFVLITAPGMPISHWHHDGSFFDEIRSKVSDAINQLPSKASIDGILWHQGESDGSNDDAYGNSLYELISNFRSESWFGEEKPFICGETAGFDVNIQLRKLNNDNDPWTACVGGEGLPTATDGAHFTAEALRTLGTLYGNKYLDLVR